MHLSQAQGRALIGVVAAFLVVVVGIMPLDWSQLDLGAQDTLRLGLQALIAGIAGVLQMPESGAAA